MKKIIFISVLFFFCIESHAQFINSIGLTVGVSAGNEKFFYREPAAIARKKYIVGFNASVFLECFNHDYARWVTEIQYNQKGSIDKRGDTRYPNQLQYICWNNYLKLRYEMYSIIPYIMVGPRLEYNLVQSTTSPDVVSKFMPLHLSAAVGGGVEFVSYYPFKFFVEAFYNPDAMPAYITPNLHIWNKNFELRVGVKYVFEGSKENCNAPTYVE